MSNFLSFLSGAAQRVGDDMKSHREMQSRIEEAAMINAQEAHEENKTKHAELQRRLSNQEPLSFIVASSQGRKWDDMSSVEQQNYIKTYDNQDAADQILKSYEPGAEPNLKNYKSKLGPHPLVKKMKEFTGGKTDFSYARAKENQAVAGGAGFTYNPMPVEAQEKKELKVVDKTLVQVGTETGTTDELFTSEKPFDPVKDIKSINHLSAYLYLTGKEEEIPQWMKDGSSKQTILKLERYKNLAPVAMQFVKGAKNTNIPNAEMVEQLSPEHQKLLATYMTISFRAQPAELDDDAKWQNVMVDAFSRVAEKTEDKEWYQFFTPGETVVFDPFNSSAPTVVDPSKPDGPIIQGIQKGQAPQEWAQNNGVIGVMTLQDGTQVFELNNGKRVLIDGTEYK